MMKDTFAPYGLSHRLTIITGLNVWLEVDQGLWPSKKMKRPSRSALNLAELTTFHSNNIDNKIITQRNWIFFVGSYTIFDSKSQYRIDWDKVSSNPFACIGPTFWPARGIRLFCFPQSWETSPKTNKQAKNTYHIIHAASVKGPGEQQRVHTVVCAQYKANRGQRMTYVLCCSSVCANHHHSRKTVTFIYKWNHPGAPGLPLQFHQPVRVFKHTVLTIY